MGRCRGSRRGRAPDLGPLSEPSAASVGDGRLRRRRRFGCGNGDEHPAQVGGGEPAVGAIGWRPDAIERVARAARSPRDHLDFDPVGQMHGGEDLAALIHEAYRAPAVARAVDEDAPPNRDHGDRARGRSRDGLAAGRKECQRTSSGKCARGARRHDPLTTRLQLSALFTALSNARHPRHRGGAGSSARDPASSCRPPVITGYVGRGPPRSAWAVRCVRPLVVRRGAPCNARAGSGRPPLPRARPGAGSRSPAPTTRVAPP